MTTWTTTTELLTHQKPAVEKLRRSRVGGLFMDMGTGKTRAAIDLAWLRRERIDHVVWLCPVSLKETICYEIIKHTDCGRAAIHVFTDRTTMRNLPAALWHIVGIESLSSSDRVTLAVNALVTERSFVVVDESSYIKGHDSLRTQCITLIGERARYRLILTGTPLSQGVEDLFAQMRFLSPKILGYKSFYSFAANHLVYSEDHPGLIIRSLRTDLLAKKIAPYTYQVTKDECLTLPPKLYDTRYCSLTPDQRRRYQQAKDEILFALDENEPYDEYVLFRLFGALQQIVCGFWNRRDPATGEQELLTLQHARLDVLLSILRDVPPAEKVIIWTKYHHTIQEIVAALREAYGDQTTAEFHGRLSEKSRHGQLERWRANTDCRFLVATQAAGGHGLTLNEASYVVFYSNEFKYSTRLQAEDRCHRIGQTRPVTYVDVVCHSTIDDRISRALGRKADAANEFRRQVNRVKDDRELLKNLVREL